MCGERFGVFFRFSRSGFVWRESRSFFFFFVITLGF